jgi:hypothetical protein
MHHRKDTTGKGKFLPEGGGAFNGFPQEEGRTTLVRCIHCACYLFDQTWLLLGPFLCMSHSSSWAGGFHHHNIEANNQLRGHAAPSFPRFSVTVIKPYIQSSLRFLGPSLMMCNRSQGQRGLLFGIQHLVDRLVLYHLLELQDLFR